MYKRTGHVINIAAVDWDRTLTTSQGANIISISELHIAGPICRIRIYGPPSYNIYPATDPDAPPPTPIEVPKKKFKFFNTNFNDKRLSGAISADGIEENIGWSTGNKYIQKDHYEIVFDAEEEKGEVGMEFLCMPLVSAAFKVPSTQGFAMGVVLVEAEGTGDGKARGNVYRRVGWCFMWRDLEDWRVRNVNVVIY